MFSDQLTYTEEGMGVTLRRDVKKLQMLAGAVETDADVNKGATYSVGRSRAAENHTD